MTTQPITRFAPDATDMEATHFGVPVVYFGEDGDMLALGHHAPRQALAAFNRHARRYCNLVNVADDRHATADDWLDSISTGWLTFTKGNPDEDFLWQGDTATASTPGVVAVTLLYVS